MYARAAALVVLYSNCYTLVAFRFSKKFPTHTLHHFSQFISLLQRPTHLFRWWEVMSGQLPSICDRRMLHLDMR